MVSASDPRYYGPSGHDDFDYDSGDYPRRRKHRYRTYSDDPHHTSRRSKRSRSQDDGRYSTRQSHHSKFDKIGKVAIAVGLIQVVAGALQVWMTKKQADREEVERRERRRAFARAKAQRRREEEFLERMERQREWEEEQRMHEDESFIPTSRRIGYTHAVEPAKSDHTNDRELAQPRSKSRGGLRRGSFDEDEDDYGYESEEGLRRSRSRPTDLR